jgi:exonuclease SbcD
MKFLHTADWHIGQLFHEHDRTYEHQQFLNWLVETIQIEEIDVLLVSGDVFDLSNPSAQAIKMFYRFLNEAVKKSPDLQIVVIAGNHDSAARLEAPKPLLESSNIYIVGVIEKDAEGEILYEKLLVRLKGKATEKDIICLAVPFVRLGEYPSVQGSKNPYTDGIIALYHELYNRACNVRTEAEQMIAMGHLHALHAEITDMDNTERAIMGGVEGVPASAFHEDIKYVALGHIHKAQAIGGKEHIRYSGSPIPLSFSEHKYTHQVALFELDDNGISALRALEVPVSIPLVRIPEHPKSLEEVIQILENYDDSSISEHLMPYLEVRVLLNGPEPALKHRLEKALDAKKLKLVKIDTKYPGSKSKEAEFKSDLGLKEMKPIELFQRVYQSKYQQEVPDELIKLFSEIEQTISQKEL